MKINYEKTSTVFACRNFFSKTEGFFYLAFKANFQWNLNIHKIGTHQLTRGDLYKTVKNTTTYGLKSVQFFGSKLWNTLPLFIRVAGTVTAFRSKLKTHFLDSYI